MASFRCFKRTWWVENANWPDGLEPEAGTVRYIRGARFDNEQDARDFCRDWNDSHDPGRLSLKCEYEEV